MISGKVGKGGLEMCSPMKARGLLSLVLLVLLCSAALAQISVGQPPQSPSSQLLAEPQTSLYPTTGTIPYLIPIESQREPLDQAFLAGTTWWDLQHPGSRGADFGGFRAEGWGVCDHLGWARRYRACLGQWTVFLPLEGCRVWQDQQDGSTQVRAKPFSMR
jgi:hypothetical protein